MECRHLSAAPALLPHTTRLTLWQVTKIFLKIFSTYIFLKYFSKYLSKYFSSISQNISQLFSKYFLDISQISFKIFLKIFLKCLSKYFSNNSQTFLEISLKLFSIFFFFNIWIAPAPFPHTTRLTHWQVTKIFQTSMTFNLYWALKKTAKAPMHYAAIL